MRHIALCLTTLTVTILAGCGARKEAVVPPPKSPAVDVQALQKQLAAERREAALQRQYIEDATRTINEVQDQLLKLEPLEKDLRRLGVEAEGGRRMKASQREAILSKIAVIKSALEADTLRLAQFRSRNAAFAGKIEAFEQAISRLETAIADKNKEIAGLHKSVSQMTKQVETLRKERTANLEEIERQQGEIVQKADELKQAESERDRAYVLIAGTRELITRGVLIETKRFLRRRVVSLSAEQDTAVFSAIDIHEDREFSLPGSVHRVKIYPTRAPSSYRLVAQQDGTSTLAIDDPDQFWLSRYLVVSVDQ